MNNNILKKQYFTILNLIFIFAAAYYGINLFYTSFKAKIIPDFKINVNTQEKVVKNSASESYHPASYYNTITKRNLFNVKDVSKQKSKSRIDLQALKQTDLKLKLLGTVAAKEESDSRAIIQDLTTRKDNIYKIGNSIKSATVKRILRKSVILNVNGKDEILNMSTQGKDQKHLPDKSSDSSNKKISNFTLKRDELDKAVKNANELISKVKIEPYSKKGEPHGFRVSRIAYGSLFKKMKLRNGDIITGVNGNPISSMDHVLDVYNQLKSSNSLALDIERRGRDYTFNYEIK